MKKNPRDASFEKYHARASELKAHYLKEEEGVSIKTRDATLVMDNMFFILTAALEDETIKKNPEAFDVFKLLLSRSMKTFRSIRFLLASGYSQDAISLLRNLTETVITARYLNKGSLVENCCRFRAYQYVEQQRNINKHRKTEPDWMPFEGEKGKSAVSLIAHEYKKFKDKYGDGQGWAGLKIEAMAEKVGMGTDYIQAYSVFCSVTHPSYMSFQSYCSLAPISNQPRWDPSSDFSAETCAISCAYLLKIVEVFAEVHGLETENFTDALNEIRANVVSLKYELGLGEPGQKRPVVVEKGKWGILPDALKVKARKDKDRDKP